MSTLICSFDGLHDNRVLRYCADFESHSLHMDTKTEAGEKVSVHFTGLLAHWFENVIQDNILFGMDEITVDVEIPSPKLNNSPPHGRIDTTEREACERKHDFEEINLGFSEAQARAALNKKLKGVRNQLKKIETELDKKRARYDELMELMASEELYADQDKFNAALGEYNGLKQELPKLEDEWLELSTQIEEETARELS